MAYVVLSHFPEKQLHSGKKYVTCKDTVMLLINCQLDSGANKHITNILNDSEAHCEINHVPLLGVASNVTMSCTHRRTHDLLTRNINAIPALMFYSPQHLML